MQLSGMLSYALLEFHIVLQTGRGDLFLENQFYENGGRIADWVQISSESRQQPDFLKEVLTSGLDKSESGRIVVGSFQKFSIVIGSRSRDKMVALTTDLAGQPRTSESNNQREGSITISNQVRE